MQITLSKELEEFVMYQLRSGAYADASQLVQEALENLREAMPDPALDQMLLEAHESSATPLTAEDFEAVRRLLGKAGARRHERRPQDSAVSAGSGGARTLV